MNTLELQLFIARVDRNRLTTTMGGTTRQPFSHYEGVK